MFLLRAACTSEMLVSAKSRVGAERQRSGRRVEQTQGSRVKLESVPPSEAQLHLVQLPAYCDRRAISKVNRFYIRASLQPKLKEPRSHYYLAHLPLSLRVRSEVNCFHVRLREVTARGPRCQANPPPKFHFGG